MPYAHRIYRILESELRRRLSFSCALERNLTRPSSKRLRAMDRASFRIAVRNDSGLALKNIRGTIRPTPIGDFRAVDFNVDSLPSGEERLIAEVEVRILEAPINGSVFDQLATVSLSAQADLSAFLFKECRSLTYVRPMSGQQQRSLPLSPPPAQVFGQNEPWEPQFDLAPSSDS